MRMLRIEEKICIGGANDTRQSQDSGALSSNPAVANFPCLSRRRQNSPVLRQLFCSESFREAVRPFQVECLIFFVGRKRLVMDKDFERCSRLVFAYVNDANVPGVPSSTVAPGAFTRKRQRCLAL